MNLTDLFRNNTLDTDSYNYSSSESDNIYVNDNGSQAKHQKDVLREESSGNKYQSGGEENNIPTGGFLPIYICDKKNIGGPPKNGSPDNNEKVKREYKTHKTAVSIKSILEKRRENTPFIKL